jgi:hypothetical protein
VKRYQHIEELESPPLVVGWFLPQLEQQYATAHAIDCRICPHRGTPLSSLPVDGDGGVVCPAHGLRPDLALPLRWALFGDASMRHDL